MLSSDEEEYEAVMRCCYQSSDDGMSETDSFVSESSDIIDEESDFESDERWGFYGDIENSMSENESTSNMCIIDGEYSSSYSDSIEGLDTDLPQIGTCEEYGESPKGILQDTSSQEFVM